MEEYQFASCMLGLQVNDLTLTDPVEKVTFRTQRSDMYYFKLLRKFVLNQGLYSQCLRKILN